MPDQPLVSIVLATCNGEAYLSDQLTSLLAQTHQNFEIIINDDQSQDGSLEILKKFAQTDSRIQVSVNQQRMGVAANFFKALERASGEFICFCDQDDYWRANKIERLLQLIQKKDQNMLAYSDLEVCDEALKVIHSSFLELSAIEPVCGQVDERIFIRNLAPGCSILFRKAVKDKMLGLDAETPFMHDHLAFALSCGMGEIAFNPEKLIQYRQHTLNTIGLKPPARFDENIFFIELKKRINFFQSRYGAEIFFDYERIKKFSINGLDAPKMLGNMHDLKYCLAMSPASLKYRLMGAVKCIFPGFYRSIKSGFNGVKCS